MNDPTSDTSFNKKIGATACVILLLHILLSIFAVTAPKQWVNANPLTGLYDKLILLGPFFHESRIKSSPHLYVSYQIHNSWSPARDYGVENFALYRERPWRFDKLHSNDFERYISYQVGSQDKSRHFQEVSASKAFRELNQFVLQELIQQPVDSVTLVYGVNTYLPESRTFRFDTILNYSYNPGAIAPAKH